MVFKMLSTIEIIKKYDLYTKKSFGQNFLTDQNLLTKIVNCAGNIENEEVFEVGTGPAGLTTAILKQNPKKLITIDLDERCVNIANNEIKPYFNNLNVIYGNALEIKESDFFENKYKIIANLPYNIGTTLLFKWLENGAKNIKSITLLLQKEVVDRIIAKNGTKDYGRLAVMSQYVCDVKKCFDISPKAFLPPPKVISSVVHLIPKQDIDIDIIPKLSNFVKILFNQRRKTIINNLKSSYNNIIDILIDENISINERAENLTLTQILNILNKIK